MQSPLTREELLHTLNGMNEAKQVLDMFLKHINESSGSLDSLLDTNLCKRSDLEIVLPDEVKLRLAAREKMPVVVEAANLSKSYMVGDTEQVILSDVNFKIRKGDFLAMVGPSGTGKTTLLNILGCIEKPTQGALRFGDTDVTALTDRELDRIRAVNLGYIFQNFNLLPVLTVAENVEFPLLQQDVPVKERAQMVAAILEEVGLQNRAHHRPGQLSGGQRQRVAIARALVGRPSIVLADEPTANLDHKTGTEIIQLMKTLNKKFQVTFIFSTHDKKIMEEADRVAELSDGKLIERF